MCQFTGSVCQGTWISVVLYWDVWFHKCRLLCLVFCTAVGDELFTDAYKLKVVDGIFYQVEVKVGFHDPTKVVLCVGQTLVQFGPLPLPSYLHFVLFVLFVSF